MSITSELDLMKDVGEVTRKLDVIAFNTARDNPELADELRKLYQQLEDATDKFVFGRPLSRWPDQPLSLVPDRPRDEVGER